MKLSDGDDDYHLETIIGGPVEDERDLDLPIRIRVTGSALWDGRCQHSNYRAREW